MEKSLPSSPSCFWRHHIPWLVVPSFQPSIQFETVALCGPSSLLTWHPSCPCRLNTEVVGTYPDTSSAKTLHSVPSSSAQLMFSGPQRLAGWGATVRQPIFSLVAAAVIPLPTGMWVGASPGAVHLQRSNSLAESSWRFWCCVKLSSSSEPPGV